MVLGVFDYLFSCEKQSAENFFEFFYPNVAGGHILFLIFFCGGWGLNWNENLRRNFTLPESLQLSFFIRVTN